jgi:hypothetical protein
MTDPGINVWTTVLKKHNERTLSLIRHAISMVAHRDAPGTPRMILKAYVCGPSCTRMVQNEGTSTLAEILISRPDKCRYAIVDVPTVTDSPFWSIDMYGLGISGNLTVYHLGPYTAHQTLDAAIVATAMHYEEH